MQAAWDELVRLKMRNISDRKASELMGIPLKTIYNWNRTPEFQSKLKKTRFEVFQRAEDLLGTATDVAQNIEKVKEDYASGGLRKIKQIMDESVSENLQLKAAIDLADRGSKTSKTKKVQQTNLSAVLTPEVLKLMVDTTRELIEYGQEIPAAPTDASIYLPVEDDVEPIIDAE